MAVVIKEDEKKLTLRMSGRGSESGSGRGGEKRVLKESRARVGT